MAERILFSPQVKQGVIISNNLVYTSCFTSCQSYEIKKSQENLKT